MQDPQRRRALKTIGSTAALLAAGVGTATATPGGGQGKRKRQGASAADTIYEIAAGSDDFDTLTAALEATGLDDVLDSRQGKYTVFAPTDVAFEGVDTSGLTTDQLRNVLLYHVTRGRRYASSVVGAPRLRMLNGGTVTVDGTTLNDGQADIVATDVEASNGVVHVVDGVLLP